MNNEWEDVNTGSADEWSDVSSGTTVAPENPQKAEAGRNYLSEAAKLYDKYYQKPVTNASDWTSNFIRDAFPATASYKRLGGELAITFDKNLSKQQAELQSNNDAIAKNIYDKYINNPEASIEQREKGVALLQTLTVPDLYSASSGFNRQDTAATMNRTLGDIGSDAFDVAMWSIGNGANSMESKFLLTPGVEKTFWGKVLTAVGTSLKFGIAQTGKTVSEGIGENKPLDETLGEGFKSGAGMAGIVAGIEAVNPPLAFLFGKIFPSVSKKLIEKVPDDLMTQIENQTKKIQEGMTTSQKAGEEILTSASLRDDLAKQELKNNVDTVSNIAADSIAPKVEGDTSIKLVRSIENTVKKEKDIVNTIFYENPAVYSTKIIPQVYYDKLAEISARFKTVEGWEGMASKAKKWLTKNTDESAQFIDDIFAAGGDNLVKTMKAQGKIPESTMAEKSIKDLVYTKEAIDGMIRYNGVQGMTTFDRPLMELSQALKEEIIKGTKGTALEGKFNQVLEAISFRKQNLGAIKDFLESDNKVAEAFKLDAEQTQAVKDMTDPDTFITLQKDVKRNAIESSKNELTGYVDPNKLALNTKLLRDNKMLGGQDILDLKEYEDFVRYFQNGAMGPTPESLTKLSELATGKQAGTQTATKEAAAAAQTIKAVSPAGENLAEKMVQADTVIDKITGLQSATLVDEVLNTIPKEIRDTLPQRIYTNAISDAFAVSKDGISKFNPEKVKTYLEGIGYGKGNKEEIIKKLIPNEVQRKLLGEFYNIATQAFAKNSKVNLRKLAHIALAFGYLQTGAKTATANHLIQAGFFKKTNKTEIEKFIKDFSESMGIQPVDKEVIFNIKEGAMTYLIDNMPIKSTVEKINVANTKNDSTKNNEVESYIKSAENIIGRTVTAEEREQLIQQYNDNFTNTQ